MGTLVKKGDMQGPRIPANVPSVTGFGGECLAGFGRTDPFAGGYTFYVGSFSNKCFCGDPPLDYLGKTHSDSMLRWVCKWLGEYNPPTTPHNLTPENLKNGVGIEIGRCEELEPNGTINYMYMCVLRWLYCDPQTTYWVRYWVERGMTHQQAIVFGFIYAGSMQMWYYAFPLTKAVIDVFTPEGLKALGYGTTGDGHDITKQIYEKHVKHMHSDIIEANKGYRDIAGEPMTLGKMILDLTE